MKNRFCTLLFLLCAASVASAGAGDVPYYAQIDMNAPPVNPTNVTTKSYVDAADTALDDRIDGVEDSISTIDDQINTVENSINDVEASIAVIENTAVFYDADGNICYPAGLSLQVKMPDGTKKDVLATDTNGNALLGENDLQVNITAIQRPSVTIGAAAPDGMAVLSDLADFVTEPDLAAELAVKADLVSGVVPDAQLPAHVKINNWGPVAADTDLITLTSATVNDRAFVGSAAPYATYYLVALPPTTQSNWIQASGGDSGVAGVESVNGLTGPAVTVDLAQFPGVQNALDDKANAADLAAYAPLASPALTGTPTAPTAPANSTGSQIINADALRTAMTGNLGATSPLMDGTASAGAATTVARSDHVYPTDTSRAAVTGNVATATALQTPRTIQTNLASTTAASFNGTANATPGVTGILPVANGGTGVTTPRDELIRLLPNGNNEPTGVAVFSDGFTNPGYTSPAQLVWIGRSGYPLAGAATATAAGATGSVVYAPDNAAGTVRNQAVTPAGVKAALDAKITYGTSAMKAGDPLPDDVIYLQYE